MPTEGDRLRLGGVAPISWTLNNPSTYLIDSGLWTACKESLLVIEKEFQHPARREKKWSLEEVEICQAERGRFTLPETATLILPDSLVGEFNGLKELSAWYTQRAIQGAFASHNPRIPTCVG